MSTRLRSGAVAGFSIAIGSVVILHIVSDLDPFSSRLSEYAAHEFGWLMTVAFVASAIGFGLLGGCVLREAMSRWHVLASALLEVACLGMILSGIFPTDPYSASVAELIHSQASGAATIAVISASFVLAFTAEQPVPSSRRLSVVMAFCAIGSVVLHETDLSGLSQRLLWAVVLVWALIASLGKLPYARESPLGVGSLRRYQQRCRRKLQALHTGLRKARPASCRRTPRPP